MNKLFVSAIGGLLAMTLGCEGSAVAQGDALDRSSLPIQPPEAAPITELDARNVTAPAPFSIKPPEGAPNVKLEFAYDGDGPGKGGLATLYVNGEKVSEGRVERTTPAVFSGEETADVGKDDATQVVAAFENVRDSHFTGSVMSVTVDTAMP